MRPHGFTLLEVLVVVMIITILATIVGVKLANEPAEARIAAARAKISVLETALDLYRMHNGQYPTEQQGLAALLERPTAEPVPANYKADGYLKKRSQVIDPWKREYVYLVPGRGNAPYEIMTYGSDGEEGGEGEAADIRSGDL